MDARKQPFGKIMDRFIARLTKNYRIVQRKRRQLVWFLKNVGCTVHEDPIFLFGNQKTGSTAIAALLARATGSSITLDMFCRTPTPIEKDLLMAPSLFGEFIRNNKKLFSTKLIKEPDLIFFLDELAIHFPNSRKVFLLRDPRDNIRSILNRLNLSGTLKNLTEQQILSLPSSYWKIILEGALFGSQGENCIETLALRWKKAVERYEARANEILLLQYEEFLKDKASRIYRLADQLGLKVTRDITASVDRQYQPRGDRSVPPLEFFGRSNLAIIETICGEKMKQYGYEPLLSAGE